MLPQPQAKAGPIRVTQEAGVKRRRKSRRAFHPPSPLHIAFGVARPQKGYHNFALAGKMPRSFWLKQKPQFRRCPICNADMGIVTFPSSDSPVDRSKRAMEYGVQGDLAR